MGVVAVAPSGTNMRTSIAGPCQPSNCHFESPAMAGAVAPNASTSNNNIVFLI